MYMNLSIGKFKVRLEVLLLMALVIYLIIIMSGYSCSKCEAPAKEGFTTPGSKFKVDKFHTYQLGNDTPVDTSKWSTPSLVIKSGEKPSEGVEEILNRPAQPVPLPEGQMAMFANTEFKPECCPNAYSNSSGCACMTVNQYNYLINRGGNNVPYSEY